MFDNSASGEALIDFPVLVMLTAEAIDFAETEDGGADLRFIDSDGSTVLAHEIESWDPTNQSATVWVKVPHIPAGATTDYIWMYYQSPGATGDENPSEVWSAEYAGVWHLGEVVTDEQTGGLHIDSVGVKDGVQNRNGPTEGKIAGAQDFDGTEDYIDLGMLATSSAVTVSVWAKSEGPGDAQIWQDIIGNQAWETGGFLLFLSPEDTDVIWRLHSSGVVKSIVRTSVATTSEWHLYTATFSGSTASLYVDGVLSSTDASITMAASELHVALGDDAVRPSGVGLFDGALDEVRISTVARSSDWIEAQYRSQTHAFLTTCRDAVSP